jgi:PEP-CTERM motif
VLRLLVLMATSFLFASSGLGSVTADLLGGAPEAISPGLTRYTYNMTLQSDVLQAGDYFVLYDFLGYKPESLASAGPSSWVLNEDAATGPYPSGLPTSNPTPVNLMWNYGGPRVTAGFEPVLVGTISATSSIGYNSARLFGSRYGGDMYSIDSPEPSTMVLFGAGLGAIFYLRRRQRGSSRP